MGKFLDNTGLTKLVELIKGSLPGKATSSTLGLVKPDNSTITIDSDGIISSSGGGGGSSLPDYPSSPGNYQLILQVDNLGTETLIWMTLSGVWQYPLQIGDDLALYQGASIHQYNDNLEVV